LDVHELSSSESEDLEPLGVSAPDSHLIGSSVVSDVPRLIVISCSDGQRLLMEIPHLSVSSIWSLDDHVSVVDQVKISVLFHL
jgi:hypothetical protein